ncbi:hypothetical protein ACFVH6_25495 [Spirillospora sp. NPDC127200]
MDSLPTFEEFLREGTLDAKFDIGGICAASGYHDAGPWLFAVRLGDGPGQVYRVASQVDGVESVSGVLNSALAKFQRQRAEPESLGTVKSDWNEVLRENSAESIEQLRTALARAGLEQVSSGG